MNATEYVNKRLLSLLNSYLGDGKRKDRNQVTLAAAAGTTQGQVSVWVTRLKSGALPKLSGIEALAKGLDVPLITLFPPPAERPDLLPALLEIAILLPALKKDQIDLFLETLKGAAAKSAEIPADIRKEREKRR